MRLRHKDDNAHYNARKMRHHRPVQLEVFYCKCNNALWLLLCIRLPVTPVAV